MTFGNLSAARAAIERLAATVRSFDDVTWPKSADFDELQDSQF
jgi:hypothetical protein